MLPAENAVSRIHLASHQPMEPQDVEPDDHGSISTKSNVPTPSTSQRADHTGHTPVEILMPFPKAGPRKGQRTRERLKSQILTDTPVREKMRQARDKSV